MGAASPALAQKTDTPLAVSASASSAKDVLTMASNGDKFDEFLKKYGDKSLDEAEKRLELPKWDPRRWEEKDFDRFAKYRKETNIAIKNQNQWEIKTWEAVINQTKENDMKIAETARKAFPIYEATLNKNGSLQGISSEAKGLIRYVAQFKIPPELAEKAENMLKYI